MSERQLGLPFGEHSSAPDTVPGNGAAAASLPIEEIAATLRPQVLAQLEQAPEPVGIHELRRALGHPALDTEPDPQSNPVNRILKEMRDAGEVVCTNPEWGEPRFSLPAVAASEYVTDTNDEAPPFIRPDRQEAFPGLLSHAWPKAHEDRDTLIVDRIGEHTTGGPHRFTIIRGDTVEAYFRRDKREAGTVVGISHANHQVRVCFREGTQGQWFHAGAIYPAVEPEADGPTVPLSNVTAAAEDTPQEKGATAADAVPTSTEPYTLDAYRSFEKRLLAGEITAVELRAGFAQLVETREAFVTELVASRNQKDLQILARYFGCVDVRRNSKPQNAAYVHRGMLQQFTLQQSVTYQPMKESFAEAVARIVAAITDQNIAAYAEAVDAEDTREQKAKGNPETLDEFYYFVRCNGADALSHEQLVTFDRLRAEQTRKQRADRKPKTVEQFAGDVEGLHITIIEGFHTRDKVPLWICQLSERVDRTTFNDLKIKARQLGGNWSSFNRDEAGFQFRNPDSATKFQELLEGDVDRTDELAARKTRKMDRASDHLRQLADSLEQTANEMLHADRQTNTVRRAEMAAGARGRAYSDLAFAGTMRSLSTALDSGEAVYLDGVRSKTHLETLMYILRRGKTSRNAALLKERGELGMWDRHRAVEDLDNRPLDIEDADYAKYPYPSVYRRHLEQAIAVGVNTKGVKQRSQQMRKRLKGEGEFIAFKRESDVEALADFCSRCRGAGIDDEWMQRALEDYSRMRRVNIHISPELRMALRELVPHLQKKREDDPVLKAEQNLIGMDLSGFFPTPKAVISRMLELAEIERGHRVLEPSAGKGDILDMLREHHPDNSVTAVELNGTLLDVLEAKGHQVERSDFLEHSGQYDRIVMNPPFELGRDIEHVSHAHSMLADGGRLVAIMSEGPFFRGDKQATAFREWFDEAAGESEQLPEDAFAGSEAFRKTGVRTRIVVVGK